MEDRSVVVSVNGRARWTKALLLATLVISLVGVFSGLLQLGLLEQAENGDISEAQAAANDARQQLIGIVQVVLYLATGVAFLAWFHRVHKNLSPLGGREFKYSPGWAVGGFFVPFLNLVRPLQVMREAWHGSDPAGLERDMGSSGPSVRNHLGTPTLIGWWWAFFLVSGFLGNTIMRLSFAENPTLGQLKRLTSLMVFSDLWDVPLALLAISLVSRITSWQDLRLARMHELRSTALPLLKVAKAS
ncbi:MAG TPA: DUF4328 domain-containing protein [Candidatus Polarisedimenticolia bacterium]|nr:DUF4328 domain-containing protein [Candidatus Polarisedimenticolia bacterium]